MSAGPRTFSRNPAIAGPTIIAELNTRIPRLTAFWKSFFGTSVGNIAWRAGLSNASAAEAIAVSK